MRARARRRWPVVRKRPTEQTSTATAKYRKVIPRQPCSSQSYLPGFAGPWAFVGRVYALFLGLEAACEEWVMVAPMEVLSESTHTWQLAARTAVVKLLKMVQSCSLDGNDLARPGCAGLFSTLR